MTCRSEGTHHFACACREDWFSRRIESLTAERDRALAAARMLREELEVSGHGAHALAATSWLDDAKPEGG